MFEKIEQLINKVSDVGVQREQDMAEKKNIRLVNLLAILVVFAAIAFMFIQSPVEPWYVRQFEYIKPFILLSILYFNSRGYFALARNILFLEVNFYCFITSIGLGFASAVHLFFIPIIFGTPLIFERAKGWNFIKLLMIPFMCLLALVYLDDRYAVNPQVYQEELRFIYMQNFSLTVLYSFALAYLFYTLNFSHQERLTKAVTKADELNKQLQNNEKVLQDNLEHTASLMDKLQASKDFFEALIHNSSDVTAVLAEDGTLQYVSPALTRITGFSAEELLNKSVFDFVHEEDRKAAIRRVESRVENKETRNSFQFRFRKVDGEYVYLESKGTNMLDNQNIQGVVVNSRDISDRMAYENKILTAERNIRSILDNNDAVIWLIDSSYKLIDYNVSFAREFFRKFNVVVKKGIYLVDILTVQEKVKWKARYDKALAGEIVTIEDIYFIDGEECVFTINFFPIYKDGKADGVTVFAREVTEQKKAERTLVFAKEKAEEAAHAKAQFLGIMSHEVRTPINGIMGLTQLLLEDNPRPDQEENLKTIKFSSENLLALVNDVLNFSKLEAGKVEFEKYPFNLKQLVTDIKNSFSKIVKDKDLLFEVAYDPVLPEIIVGDSVKLSQILTNLIYNALKFTTKGYVKVKVLKIDEDASRIIIRFEIEDTGIGIAKEKQEIIFESFVQASADVHRNFGGTGLGLAITRKLLELQNSQIQVDSEEGKGSVFSFNLFFDKVEPKHLAEGFSNNNNLLKDRKILVVDDNPVNQLVAKKYLEKWEALVYLASDGLQAVEMVGKHSFDLVLMDIQMPGMDGFETAGKIRAILKDACMPILIMSASMHADFEQQSAMAGISGFIAKPFDQEIFYNKLVEQLQSAGLNKPA